MSLADFCVRRPVFTTMLVMLFVVTGVFSFHDLSVDLLPKADPATVVVNLNLPGASPDELNSAVVEPTEQSLSSIAGIDEMQAVIREGNGRITLKFVLERDINDAAQDVREKVAQAIKDLPPEVEPPIITKVDPDADPVVSFALSGSLPLRALTEIADKQIRRAIETVDGVGEVTISGGQAREIQVILDIEKLNAHGLTVDRVRDAIVAENVEVPGGYIQQGDAELTLRTLGRLESTEQFANIVVTTTASGTPIRLRDVAAVEDTTAEARTGAFFDGQRTLVMDVRRQSGQNTVQVVEAVRAKLDSLRRALPPEVKVTVTRDDSQFIHASIASLEEHLVLGSLLASLVIMVFIRNLRVVLVASLAIPASIIASFALIRAAGFTLNSMTLLGLTLAVGIVIDDAIVVLENIFRHMEEEGTPPFQAAIDGTQEVTLAVIATSVSLIVIFLPVAFMTGYTQRFIYPFGFTMAFAVMVSLLVSLTLTPMLSARIVRTDGRVHRHGEGVLGKIDAWYRRSLEWSLDHRGVIVAVSVLAFSSSFVLSRMVGRSFLPERGHGRVPAGHRHARGHVAQGHGEDGARAHAAAARRAGHRARDADHLRARQPLAHLHPAEAVRRAEGNPGAGGGRRPQDHARASGVQADDRDAHADRRRRDGLVSDPVEPDGARVCARCRAMPSACSKDVQAMPFISDSKAVVNLSNPELRVVSRSPACRGPRRPDRRSRARAPADGERRRTRSRATARKGSAIR